MALASEPVTFQQISGAVGSLLLLWSRIERALSDGLQELCEGNVSKSAHGIARSLDRWLEKVTENADKQHLQSQICQQLVEFLKDALETRNRVAHGLSGISAGGDGLVSVPHLNTELNGQKRTVTWLELQEMFAQLSRAPDLIGLLTDVAKNPPSKSDNERLLPWKDFPLVS